MFPFAKGHETIRMYHQPNGYQEESPISSTRNWLSTFCTNNWLSMLMRWATIQHTVKMTYCTKRWYSWENRQRHMQNKTKKATWRSKTELNFCCCLHCTFPQISMIPFGKKTKIPLVISIYAWNVLKVYNLGMFLGLCLGWRGRVIFQKFLCSIIKHISYVVNFSYVDFNMELDCVPLYARITLLFH